MDIKNRELYHKIEKGYREDKAKRLQQNKSHLDYIRLYKMEIAKTGLLLGFSYILIMSMVIPIIQRCN